MRRAPLAYVWMTLAVASALRSGFLRQSRQQIPAQLSRCRGPRTRCAMTASAQPSEPLFKVGLISDIQYADLPTGKGHGGRPRYYRDALGRLKEAAAHWKREGTAFGIHMGDIIDGQNAQMDASQAALDEVLSAFEGGFGGRVYHVLGNHCLYNAKRPELHERLGLHCEAEPECAYMSVDHGGFRFLFLDGYDVSVLWPEGHPKRDLAKRVLRSRNPNKENPNSPVGLVGLDRRFVAFGGGIGAKQLDWLRDSLVDARAKGLRVVVCSHQAIHPKSADGLCLLWNYHDVLKVLERFGGDTVVATFAGHAHRYGQHACRDSGITHRVLEAVLEAPPGQNAYGWLEVWPDRLVLRGVGVMQDMEVRFRPLPPQARPRQQEGGHREGAGVQSGGS